MMAYSDDHIALAAEYALGTLDAGERAQAESMMAADEDFAAMVEAWGRKLGALNQMVGSVEPRPEVWEGIKAAIAHAEPQAPLSLPLVPPLVTPLVTPLALPLAPPPIAPEADAAAARADSNVIRLAANVRRWRSIASVTSAVAAGLVALIGVGVSVPDLLPDSMRPSPKTRIVEAKAPPVAAPSAQYVAVLQKEGGWPAFILTVDEATKSFTVRKVEASAEPGKSFELWLISDRLSKPRSLGVIGDGNFTSRPLLASYDADIVKSATYAVTVEQAGGSPDGNPHSAPEFTGKLIETVPPTTR